MSTITVNRMNKIVSFATVLLTATLLLNSLGMRSVQANVSNAQVTSYAAAMKSAANTNNINSIAQLIADDAVISISRNNKSWTVGKSDYLKLLEENWQSASNYSYSMDIKNVVLTGSNAKADIHTVEKMVKNGQKVTLITESRATLTEGKSGALLLRSVSQITLK